MLLSKLHYDIVDVVGYSFGGGAAFRLAVQHPDLVRRLVLVSTPFARDGWYPEMLPQQAAMSAATAEAMKPTPMYQSYVKVAPRPQDFPRLLDRMGEFMRGEHMSKNRLAILPNLTHYEMFMAPVLVTTVLPFLNGEQGPPVWTTTPGR